jgi:VIT1/CCC1 family predicted Fe2+/Mn2+ transporter
MIASSARVLDPAERIAEMLFGLIMVLTFTGSLSIADAGRDDVRVMLIGALGCNVAWGLIDAVLYLMGCLAERGRDHETYRAVRQAADPAEARRLIAAALPPILAQVLEPDALDRANRRLRHLPVPMEAARLSASDWRGACGVFLVVFLATFPVAVPFLLVESLPRAMRLSNGVAVVMLFAAGCAYGRLVGRPPAAWGVSMVALGSVLVALTIALGG